MSAKVLRFANTDIEITRIKAQILDTLRAAELPGCYLRKPVSLLDIRQYCQALDEMQTPWFLAAFELEAEDRIQTVSRNGQLYLNLNKLPAPAGIAERVHSADEARQPEECSRKERGGPETPSAFNIDRATRELFDTLAQFPPAFYGLPTDAYPVKRGEGEE